MKRRWVLTGILLLGVAAVARGQAAPGASTMAGVPRVPGVVIDHSPAASKVYIGSPSIVALGSGNYVASHDVFGAGSDSKTTKVFASHDRGASWMGMGEITGQYWSTLFVHGGTLFVMGTSGEYGHVVIRRSVDGGKTWTVPRDGASGLLRGDGRFHCAPVPVVEHNGRIWRAMEDVMGPAGWPTQFRCFMMSAPAGSDLLKAANWTSSEPLTGDGKWLNGKFNGWLEGNAVAGLDGQVVDILRVDDGLAGERAAVVRISEDGKRTAFDPQAGFVEFYGGAKKFTIRFDGVSKRYWSLSNYVPAEAAGGAAGGIRNTLALISSTDLKAWTVCCVLLHHSDKEAHAFQYVDWQIEGDDLIAVARTAFEEEGGVAHSGHDANYLTFHRIGHFRELTMKDSVPVKGPAPVTFENADFSLVGRGIELAALKMGSKAFANREYVWENVPAAFEGWQFTRMAGGEAARISVHAKRPMTLYGATVPQQAGIDVTGWKPMGDSSFKYSDREHSKMQVFRREFSAGEEWEVPQGNWSGMMVLLPAAVPK